MSVFITKQRRVKWDEYFGKELKRSPLILVFVKGTSLTTETGNVMFWDEESWSR